MRGMSSPNDADAGNICVGVKTASSIDVAPRLDHGKKLNESSVTWKI